MSHTKKHGIDSNTDHDGVSGATTGNLVQFDASGLPADSNKKEGDFLLIDGTRAMTGNIQLNGNYLSNDGDNEGIVIDSSGNVGIGTNTPGGKLDITETTGADVTMNLQAGEASNAILQIVADDGDDDADKYRLISKADNNFQIESYAPGSWTSRLAIDSSGKIGLNESSPNSAIDIDDAAGGTDKGFITMGELISDAAAPPSNHVALFCRDSGGGKTQICARFATGAVQVLATEP